MPTTSQPTTVKPTTFKPSTPSNRYVQRGVDINGEATGDNFGFAVSLSSDGSILAIGAPFNNAADSGHVRVYAWNGTSSRYVQRGVDIDGEATDDFSGISVSLSSDGNILAIGAIGNDGNSTDSGHVRVYAWNGTTHVKRGVDIDGEGLNDESGRAVSLSSDGSILAIGATLNTGKFVSSGHVRVYAWNGSNYVQRGLDIDGEAAGDRFGQSVSLSSDGSVLAIGASSNDDNGSASGHVRVYAWNDATSNYVQRSVDIVGEAAGDQSGYSVSLSSDGSILAVGAYLNDGNGTDSGHVRVFAWNSLTYVQRGVDIDGEATGDRSGQSVSLSSDGRILAIGARTNDGNGLSAGHVRVYAWNNEAFVQRGVDLEGEAASDNFGQSVSLSSDGSILAVGAILNDGNGIDSGHVRVFEFIS